LDAADVMVTRVAIVRLTGDAQEPYWVLVWW
jgi:hypothetical protein